MRWLPAASLAAFLLPAFAYAQECTSYQDAVDRLLDKYGEVETARALSSSARSPHAVVLFVGKDGETWTLVAVSPENCVNLLDAGEGWSEVTPKASTL